MVEKSDSKPRRTYYRSDRFFAVFLGVVLLHIVEHAAQGVQIFALQMPRAEALGALGLVAPSLVESEALHYGHAIFMLVGLVMLRHRFAGTSRAWWDAALILQVWHHFEHLLLLFQAFTRSPLFGASASTSVLQLWVPRAELHIFYNVMVLFPMCLALIYRSTSARGPATGDTVMTISPSTTFGPR